MLLQLTLLREVGEDSEEGSDDFAAAAGGGWGSHVGLRGWSSVWKKKELPELRAAATIFLCGITFLAEEYPSKRAQ